MGRVPGSGPSSEAVPQPARFPTVCRGTVYQVEEPAVDRGDPGPDSLGADVGHRMALNRADLSGAAIPVLDLKLVIVPFNLVGSQTLDEVRVQIPHGRVP